MPQVHGVMVRGLCVALSAGLLCCGLAGCGVRNPTAPSEQSASSTAAATTDAAAKTPESETISAEQKEEAKVVAAFRTVLDNPDTYMSFDDAKASELSFEYALINITPDGAPVLLVKASGAKAWGGMDRVRIFAYEPTATDSVQPYAQHISIGAAEAGGARAELSATKDAHGLLYSEHSSGTGKGEIQRITPSGNDLKATYFSAVDLSQEQVNPFMAELAQDIPWAKVNDSAQLDSYAQGSWVSPGTAASINLEEVANKAGYVVVSGRVHVLSAMEVLGLMLTEDPNPEYTKKDTRRYVMLDLGSPQNLTVVSGDGTKMRSGSSQFLLLDLADATTMESLDEQNVTIAFKPEGTHWPSDTSVPLGVPRMSEKSNVCVIELG